MSKFERAMTSRCPQVWETWKTQRNAKLQNWDIESTFERQLNSLTHKGSRQYLLQDLILARIPAGYYSLHMGKDQDPPFSSATCPRLVLVESDQRVGLGHRISNFLQATLLSHTFGLDHLVENLDVSNVPNGWANHGDYTGMTEFLGLSMYSRTTIDDISEFTVIDYEKNGDGAGTFSSRIILTSVR